MCLCKTDPPQGSPGTKVRAQGMAGHGKGGAGLQPCARHLAEMGEEVPSAKGCRTSTGGAEKVWQPLFRGLFRGSGFSCSPRGSRVWPTPGHCRSPILMWEVRPRLLVPRKHGGTFPPRPPCASR